MKRAWVLMLATLMSLSACRDTGAPATGKGSAKPAATVEDIAFASEHKQWREARLADVTQPDGWTSLIGLHWLGAGAHYVGSAADNGIRLAKGPAQLGMLDVGKEGALRLGPARAAELTLDDGPLTTATALKSDSDEGGPSRIGFDQGKGIATVIKRGDRYALRVKHADAEARTGFAGLDYWPASRQWLIEGRFVPHPPGKTIPIANIIGTIDDTPNPGAVEFARAGKRYRLEALDEGDGQLFLVFADRSNGRGSYSAGRFLYANLPDAQGRVMLDFNRSYNPPCAFTAFATCPLPPPENRLDLAIAAGEKAYAKPPHL
jgi:hypothetical protein